VPSVQNSMFVTLIILHGNDELQTEVIGLALWDEFLNFGARFKKNLNIV
jgi:cellobiose-specific phosphotransferase system component IIA